MKRTKRTKALTVILPIKAYKQLDRHAYKGNTFLARLIVAIVEDAIPRLEDGSLKIETAPRIGS